MAKVDWITWKTDPSEIINPDEIENKIDLFFENYNTYMNPIIYEQIKSEILFGGLSKDSFSISGSSPSNEIAVDIINKIDEIKQCVERLKIYVKKLAIEQKKIEKNQLISEIQDKIYKENQLINQVSSNRNVQQNIENLGSSSDDILYVAYDRIQKLNDKLERVQLL